MAQFSDGESGASVRTKINASIGKTDLITVTGAKDLDAIEDGATADQTAAEIAAMSQDWRGQGGETLISATVALQAGVGGGDVSKVGTPVDDQVSVWTGDGTIEGLAGLVYDGSALGVTGDITVSGTVDGRDLQIDGTKLDGVEAGATGDQTPGEIAATSQDWRGLGSETLIAATAALQSGSVAESLIIAASDETTALTTGTGKMTFRMPYAFTLTDIRASVSTAPTGSVLTVDVNEGGATILSTKLTIDATEKTSTTAAVAPVISDVALADDAEITIDIDTIGSTVAGAGLKVTLIGDRA